MKRKESLINLTIGGILIFKSGSIDTYLNWLINQVGCNTLLFTKAKNNTVKSMINEKDKVQFLNFGKYKKEKIFNKEIAIQDLKKAIK
jgi:hypothetical protein